MFPSFRIFEFIIYSYPLLLGVATAIGYVCSNRLSVYEQNWTRKEVRLRLLFLLVISWLGAKSFFIAFSYPADKELTSSVFFNGGGFVFYGGLLAGLFYVMISSIRNNLKINEWAFLVPALALAHAVGRIGCLLAGCCFGIEYGGFGSIDFIGTKRVPVQLIEASLLFVLGMFLWKSFKNTQNHKKIILIYLLSYSVVRFFIEFLRADEIRGIWWAGLSVSQWISVGILAASVAVVITMRFGLWRQKETKNEELCS